MPRNGLAVHENTIHKGQRGFQTSLSQKFQEFPNESQMSQIVVKLYGNLMCGRKRSCGETISG